MTSKEWKSYKLGELAEVKGGKRLPKGVNLISKRNTHPYIRVRDLGKNKILQLNNDFEYIDDETQKTISRYIVDKDDVIISIVGTIGLIGIVGASLDKANLTENCVKLINLENIGNHFLYYWLISPLGQDEINKGTVGAVQAKLPIKNIQDFIINLPPLETQQKIAKVLSAIDEKIELNNSINNNLEQQIKNLYNNFFCSCNDEIKITELVDVRDGTHDSPKITKQGKHLITSKHLKKYGVDKSTANIISELDYVKINERSIVCTNDILISMIGTVGIVSLIIENPVDFAVKNVGIFKTSDFMEYTYYIHCFLNSNNTQNYIKSHLAGTTQKYISLGELRNLIINKPDETQLSKFNLVVHPLYQQIILNEKENTRLIELRDTLLPKLMSGEIDVSNIDISTDKLLFNEENKCL